VVTPQVGDIGLTKGGGPVMAIVRWGTGVRHFSWGRFWRVPADFGHAAICVGTFHVEAPPPYGLKAPSAGEVVIIEATPKNVIIRNTKISNWTWSTGGPFDGQLTPERRAGIALTAAKQLDKGYDWPGVADFLRQWANSSYKGRDQDHPDSHLFCSELDVWSWRENGVVGLYDGNPPGPTPGWRAPGSICPEELKLTVPENLRNGWKVPG
jgi:hypothetical protein